MGAGENDIPEGEVSVSGAVIIGSRAIDNLFPGELGREPKDVDVIATTDVADSLRGDSNDVFSHPTLDQWVGTGNRWATLDEIYTLKVSHSYWELKNGSWDKHIYDLRFLRRKGARLDLLLHDELYRVWESLHGSKKTNLAMEKDQFFKDAVVRIYDHDSIHESVAYGETALYNSILREGSTVDIDSKKLWSLGYDNLILLFREEVYATALERILIPRDYKASPGAAYRWALRRTITSLTKGKSARFIVDNFDQFAIPDDYLSRHLSKRDRLIKL